MAFFYYKFKFSRDKSSPIQQICPCFMRFNILAYEVYQYFNKISDNRKILSFSMSFPDSFRLKNCIYLFFKRTGQHILSLSALFNVPVDKVCQKLGKKHKIFENWTSLCFCHFRSQVETFSFRTMLLSLH